MTPIRISFLLLTLAGAARAACPTGADISAGIRFNTVDGEFETFRRLDNGLIQAYYGLDSHIGSRTLLARGIYLLEVVEMENGNADPTTRTTYSFPMPHDELPEPEPGVTWEVRAATYANGRIDSERQVYEFGTLSEKDYGGCRYAVQPITIFYPGENDPDRRDVIHYLPEFGISYLAEFHDRETNAIYEYTSIEGPN